MIAEGITIPWYSFLRCQYVDEELVVKMRKTGCQGVFLGVESGSDTILKKMKKGAIIRFYWDGLRWLKDNGITTVGSFICGYPGETAATVDETRTFIEKSGLDYYFIQPFYYLHHTPIHKKADKYRLTGEGLYWSHATMEWTEAMEHLNRLFLEIRGSTFVNPDYTLWEIAYLKNKGMDLDQIKRYRQTINDMTKAQMTRFGLVGAGATSRDAEACSSILTASSPS
jgi:p-methyltransferase